MPNYTTRDNIYLIKKMKDLKTKNLSDKTKLKIWKRRNTFFIPLFSHKIYYMYIVIFFGGMGLLNNHFSGRWGDEYEKRALKKHRRILIYLKWSLNKASLGGGVCKICTYIWDFIWNLQNHLGAFLGHKELWYIVSLQKFDGF